MARIHLEPQPPSAHFEARSIILEPEVHLRVGRTGSKQEQQTTNALFNNPFVSTNHGVLQFLEGKLLFKDTSKNGSFLNGSKLLPRKFYQITSGDTIELGFDVFHNRIDVEGIIMFIKFFPPEEEDPETRRRLAEEYPQPLQVYDFPPEFNFDLEDLYAATIERMRALEVISKIGDYRYTLEEKWVESVTNQLREGNLPFVNMVMRSPLSSKEEYVRRRRDHLSHYILLFGCCLTNSNRLWFLNQETKLLQVRWSYLTENEQMELVRQLDLNYEKISPSKKEALVEKSDGLITLNEDYFAVSFHDSSDVVKHRTIFLEKGKAFLTSRQLIAPVAKTARSRFYDKLKAAKRKYSRLEIDERLKPLIIKIGDEARYAANAFSGKKRKKLTPFEIHELSEKFFPLCMETLHKKLVKHSHLRNGGRLQYNLFLKGVGVPLQDALTFWKLHFTKQISERQFRKRYEYHIKHQYGEIGKRADYPPMNCDKILDAKPGPLDHHGCPFKVNDKEGISTLLRKKGLKEEAIEDIWSSVEGGTPTFACGKYFEISHGAPYPGDKVNHPNMYFLDSKHVRGGDSPSGASNEEVTVSPNAKRRHQCSCSSKALDW